VLQDERRIRDLAGQIGWPERITSLEARIERFDHYPVIGERPMHEMRLIPE
jgi:hypothetical protein